MKPLHRVSLFVCSLGAFRLCFEFLVFLWIMTLLGGCASIAKGGPPTSRLAGMGVRCTELAVCPWPGLEFAARAAREALDAAGYRDEVWIDVLAPSETIGDPARGIGASPYRIDPSSAGSIGSVDHGLGSLTRVVIVKQGDGPGGPPVDPCEIVSHETTLHLIPFALHGDLNQNHDPKYRPAYAAMLARCNELRKAAIPQPGGAK